MNDFLAPRRLWNSAEVWTYLGVHECTLRRYMKQAKITGYKVGGRWKFDPEEVKRFVQQGNARSSEEEEPGGSPCESTPHHAKTHPALI